MCVCVSGRRKLICHGLPSVYLRVFENGAATGAGGKSATRAGVGEVIPAPLGDAEKVLCCVALLERRAQRRLGPRSSPRKRPAPLGPLHHLQRGAGRKEPFRHRPMSTRLILEIHQLSGELRGNGCFTFCFVSNGLTSVHVALVILIDGRMWLPWIVSSRSIRSDFADVGLI